MTQSSNDVSPSDERVRLDKWLWAARFFKTRALAAEAIDGGKIDVGGTRAKRARPVQMNDLIAIRRSPFEMHVVVRGLSHVRGPASVATTLYEETPESRQARETLALQLKNAPGVVFDGAGRPTKRDRRKMIHTFGER